MRLGILLRVLGLNLLLAAGAVAGRADEFTILDDANVTHQLSARIAAEGQGVIALEQADGQYQLVTPRNIQHRKPEKDPVPFTPAQLLDQLRDEFGADQFRGVIEAPYVVGLVLSSPLPKVHEPRANAFLKKGARFFKGVEGVVLEFFKDVKVETRPPTYPLVVLIFEADSDFEAYSKQSSGGRGLSPESIAGYYSQLSNRLVLRMNECHTFEVPLHEAVHQQVHNRGMVQRMAPIPTWFHEGIATGFEGNGDRITGPLRLNSRYARRSMQAKVVNWTEIVGDDSVFHGDVLAGEAYSHAWSLHWFLVTKYKKQYCEYLDLLARKPPLEKRESPEERLAEFQRIFGSSVASLQKELPQALDGAVKRQKIPPEEPKKPGLLNLTSHLGEVELTAISRNGVMEVEGRLRNISSIRPMSFYITAETDAGTYADWFVPNLASLKVAPLNAQVTQKVIPNAPGGPARSFRVRIRAAVPESEMGQEWQKGKLPTVIFDRGTLGGP